MDKYKVIALTNGNDQRRGGIFIDEFDTFIDAAVYRDKNNQQGNIHIKMPDGSWWPEDYASKADQAKL